MAATSNRCAQALVTVVAFSFIASAHATDVVLTRDGRKISGPVKSCIADRCQVGSKSVPRNTIEWIGLDVREAPKPPAIKDASSDEEHLRDGTIDSGTLIGLNLGQVVTDRTNYARADVAWIHLAAPKSEQPSAIGGSEAPQPQPQPTPEPAPQPTPQPQPNNAPPKPKRPEPKPTPGGMKPCPADNPLGGRVVFTNEYVQNGCRGTNRYVIRFPLVHFWLQPEGRPWPEQVYLGFNESRINYDVSTTGCSGETANGEEQCQAPGGRRSGTWVRAAKQLPYIRFEPDKPQLTAINLPAEITSGFDTALVCVGPHARSGGGRGGWSGGTHGFAIEEEGNSGCANNEGNVFCVPQAGECSRPSPDQNHQCLLTGDRHALFPFRGDKTWRSPRADDRFYQGLVQTHIQWDVCCGCAALPVPPDASSDPCGDTATADALAQRNRDERNTKKTSLEESWSEYKKDMAAAQTHLSDFQTTIARCNIQSAATKILIGTLGLFTPAGEAEIAGEGPEVAEAIAEAAEELGELVGDPGVTTAEVVEKILAGEDPTASAVPNEAFQNFRKAGEEAARAEQYLNGANVDQLEERVEQCAGTIALSNDTFRGARDYVEKLKEGTDRLAGIQTLVNDIRNLDNSYPSLLYNAWAACVRHARCKGTPESECDAKKPAGEWPPVQ